MAIRTRIMIVRSLGTVGLEEWWVLASWQRDLFLPGATAGAHGRRFPILWRAAAGALLPARKAHLFYSLRKTGLVDELSAGEMSANGMSPEPGRAK